MISVDFLIDTSGSMNEQAKLPIIRDAIKTLNMYHLVDDLHFLLNIYQWGDGVECCALENVIHLTCKNRSNFHQLSDFIKNSTNDFIFIATDGGFNKSELDILKDIDEKPLSKVYIIIIGQEDIYSLQKSQIFEGRIFLSTNMYDLINRLYIKSQDLNDISNNRDGWD